MACFRAAAAFVAVVAIAAALPLISGPLHASCKASWTLGVACEDARTKLVAQVQLWSTGNCGSGAALNEKCLYSIISQGDVLTINHETPVQHYNDTIKFSFSSSASAECAVTGYSSSNLWYAVLDQGTNYCNMHNLITGAGLNATAGYKENTSDDICTQYSSANCQRY